MKQHIAHRPRDIAACVSIYLQAGDLDGITTLFHPDCLIFFPPDEPPSVGIAGAWRVFESFLDIRPSIESEVLSEVIVDDIALLRANWRVIAPDGTVLAEGQSTEVAKKAKDGSWRYLIDCPNGPPELL